MYKIVDFKTKKVVKPKDLVFASESSPWEIMMDLDLVRESINRDYFSTATPCLSKYLPLMPIEKPAEFLSLREQATPLLRSKYLGQRLGIDLYFKIEGKNPTGSFKDRGSAIEISIAREFGAKGIILASTGNMAASCACYAAAAKIPCFVIVPEGVSMSKLAQVISYGGNIVQVKGTYNDAADVAYKVAKKLGFYLAGDYAFRVEGQKTASFEIVDQMLGQSPDAVIVPIGCGTNITAYGKGFDEYKALGFIDNIPQLIGVQSTGANAVAQAYKKKKNVITPLSYIDTVASAIAVPDPLDGLKALAAIRNSKGDCADVSDEKILSAQYLLSTQEGLFVESASASTIAYLLELEKTPKKLAKLVGKKVICVLGGDGLKEPSVVLKSAIKPVSISPDPKNFIQLYEDNFFTNKSMIFCSQNEVLFSDKPTLMQLRKQLHKLFGSHYSKEYVSQIRNVIEHFLAKGKPVSVSDLQYIVQDVGQKTEVKLKKELLINDFSVETLKNKAPCAYVNVTVEGQKFEAKEHGVGPVDALINALKSACKGNIDFKLTDYKVEIRSEGVDAAVFVELKLIRGDSSSIGQSTSPDIIQASVEAFEDAYNGFVL